MNTRLKTQNVPQDKVHFTQYYKNDCSPYACFVFELNLFYRHPLMRILSDETCTNFIKCDQQKSSHSLCHLDRDKDITGLSKDASYLFF